MAASLATRAPATRTDRLIANAKARAAKRNRIGEVAIAAYFDAIRGATVSHYVDDQGRTVRKINGADHRNHVSDKEVTAFLKNVRSVEEEEVLEALGVNVFKSLVKRDCLRKDTLGAFFWVTQAAADKYGLPAIRGVKFPR